ncbi:Cupredoxin [Pterulicium gracile]|uniref:Cupredoxin n=1 Tax=Pterulicium gracile TaxID=1884261 RepID=A0A5C3R0K7_9AGAR|nr:Cupredoxin [Pterula gracilis]
MTYSLITAGVEHHVVAGGPDILRFDPPRIVHYAVPGDVIIFSFRVKNHTATQSSLGGFNSGLQPVAPTLTEGFPTYNVTSHDEAPIWVYCAQGNHCQQGMLFSVNSGEGVAPFYEAATGGAVPAPPPVSTSPPPVEGGDHPPLHPQPEVVTVTATVTVGGDIWTTTYGSWPGSPQPTAPQSTEHRVSVGADGQFVFSPSKIKAQPGDTVLFEFNAKNHNLTSSSFNAPGVNSGLFNSGFIPVAPGTTEDLPTLSLTINDTAPIWAYCAQGNHCGQGMIFSVNAVEDGPNAYEAFLEKAKQLNGTATEGPGPGAPPPSESDDAEGGDSEGPGGGAAAMSIPGVIAFLMTAAASFSLL